MHNAKNISQRNILRIKACSLSWTVKKWPGLFNQTTARPSNRWLEWHDETSLIAESQNTCDRQENYAQKYCDDPRDLQIALLLIIPFCARM
jgi:hypothetical protein